MHKGHTPPHRNSDPDTLTKEVDQDVPPVPERPALSDQLRELAKRHMDNNNDID